MSLENTRLSSRTSKSATATQDRSGYTDIQLVGRILKGDENSFELLMRRYNRFLFRLVRGILKDDREAEDVVQDTYVRAYRHSRNSTVPPLYTEPGRSVHTPEEIGIDGFQAQ